mgnify:CR=1 FL=1
MITETEIQNFLYEIDDELKAIFNENYEIH